MKGTRIEWVYPLSTCYIVFEYETNREFPLSRLSNSLPFVSRTANEEIGEWLLKYITVGDIDFISIKYLL
jgi:hypothetical protein